MDCVVLPTSEHLTEVAAPDGERLAVDGASEMKEKCSPGTYHLNVPFAGAPSIWPPIRGEIGSLKPAQVPLPSQTNRVGYGLGW